MERPTPWKIGRLPPPCKVGELPPLEKLSFIMDYKIVAPLNQSNFCLVLKYFLFQGEISATSFNYPPPLKKSEAAL